MTFIDLAGHEKYLRSMIYGISSSLLDYSLVLINARAGVTHMTHHHLTVCAMMNIPIVILFSKVDGCPPHRMKQTVEETKELLKAPDIRKRLVLINPGSTGSTGSTSTAGGKDKGRVKGRSGDGDRDRDRDDSLTETLLTDYLTKTTNNSETIDQEEQATKAATDGEEDMAAEAEAARSGERERQKALQVCTNNK